MTDQLSLLPDLDRASDSRKQNLCATWKNARANDCDVLTENMMEFEANVTLESSTSMRKLFEQRRNENGNQLNI